MSGIFVYDSGMLIAIDDVRRPEALESHRLRMTRRHSVMVPAVVAAQVVRSPSRQARLMGALSGCELLPFDSRHHVAVGRLLAASGTSDVVDAFVAVAAAGAEAAVVTSDPGDIRRLLSVLGADVPVLPP